MGQVSCPQLCPQLPPDVNRLNGATLDSQKPENPAELQGYGLYWISLDVKLVEAGGIEPPSERFQSKVSTCLVSVLNLTQVSSQRQDSTRASPDHSRPTRPEHTRQTSPFK